MAAVAPIGDPPLSVSELLRQSEQGGAISQSNESSKGLPSLVSGYAPLVSGVICTADAPREPLE